MRVGGGASEYVCFPASPWDVARNLAEEQCRLSDIALERMVEAAQGVPHGIRIDGDVLRLYPSPAGAQHDECKSGRFGRFWKKGRRIVPDDAVLHPTVKERFAQPQVLHYDVMKPYRPPNLRHHREVKQYYEDGAGMG